MLFPIWALDPHFGGLGLHFRGQRGPNGAQMSLPDGAKITKQSIEKTMEKMAYNFIAPGRDFYGFRFQNGW